MSVRQTLRHLRSFVGVAWTIAKNWRALWKVHTEIQESEWVQKLEDHQSRVAECDDCGSGSLCYYHSKQFDEIQQEVEHQAWEVDE